MNAILENSCTRTWKEIGEIINIPKAILAVSAHYMRTTTSITGANKPKTVYDFYGFPQELYAVNYKMQGSETLAWEIAKRFPEENIEVDPSAGIDHWVWSILMHVFPDLGTIPVLEISLNSRKSPQEIYELGKKFATLRDEWYMIFGSGNIVHNLSLLNWTDESNVYPWAWEVDRFLHDAIEQDEVTTLVELPQKWGNFAKASPTREHYLPLLFVLWLKGSNERPHFFNEIIVHGALSMTSFWYE